MISMPTLVMTLIPLVVVLVVVEVRTMSALRARHARPGAESMAANKPAEKTPREEFEELLERIRSLEFSPGEDALEALR